MATHRKTPETLTAVDRAAALQRQGTKLPELSIDQRPQVASRAQVRQAAYGDQVRASMGTPIVRPLRSTGPVPSLDPKADADDSFSMLPIGEIETYQHNPRTGRNPRYEDIRASIIADGITNPITVTRPTPTAKYHPYGGGNTRLEIAKELFEAGDDRFAHLKVIVKSWPGHANVISAHLSENENRGDISFWERAQGVADFKKQFEAEHGVVLSTGELARELKAHGINFGVKVIQNFAFAVENLHPLGPWLKATDVNEVLRPGLSGAIAAAEKFDISSKLFGPVLLAYRDRLLQAAVMRGQAGRAYMTEEPGTQRVELDTVELVNELHQALANAIGVSPEVIPLMVNAVDSNSRITAEELRAIQIRKAESPAAKSGSTFQPPVTAPAPQQRSLAGMLAGVPTPPEAACPMPPSLPSKAAGTATPSPASADGASGTAIQPMAPPAVDPTEKAQKRNPRLPDQIQETDPTAHVLSLVLDISDLVVLHDCILHVPGMPFGYLMDLPASLENVGDKTIPYPQLRAAAWKLLASLSGQVDPTWFTYAGLDKSRWTQAAMQGPDVFRQTYVQSLHGFTSDGGDPAMLLAEVYLMFSQPELGYLTVQLLRAMEQLRLDHPGRFTRAVTPDPDLTGLPD